MDDQRIDILVASFMTGTVLGISYYFTSKCFNNYIEDKIISTTSHTSSIFKNTIKCGLLSLSSAYFTVITYVLITKRYYFPVQTLVGSVALSSLASISFLFARGYRTLTLYQK